MQTAPAQEDLGRIGRTKEQGLSRALRRRPVALQSSKKREGHPWQKYHDILRRAADHFGSSTSTLDQPWRSRTEKREVDPGGSVAECDAVGGL